MRKQPSIPPPEKINPKSPNIQTREYKLITPLFGGGVTPEECDPIQVIRATEIRGQLRFWWRACRSWQFSDQDGKKAIQCMKEREDAIWGKANKKADKGIPYQDQVTIEIRDPAKRKTEHKPIAAFIPNGKNFKVHPDLPEYAAFPLRPENGKTASGTFIKDVSFTLGITYPQDKEKRIEIEAALWAWETFGGLGARTRRGFGALALEKIDQKKVIRPKSTDMHKWIQTHLNMYIAKDTFPPRVPHLCRDLHSFLLILTQSQETISVWHDLIIALRDFRQTKDSQKASVWPEKDHIAALQDTQPDPSTQIKDGSAFSFPRAAFGLPIIFHFKNQAYPDHTLNEENSDQEQDQLALQRFASPLILRPLLYEEGKSVGLAIFLQGSKVNLDKLILQAAGTANSRVHGNLTDNEVKALKDQGLPFGDQKDLLVAFRTFLSKKRK